MKHKELMLAIKGWMLLGLVVGCVVISLFITTNAQAGGYLDLGFSYIDKFGIVERGEVSFGDYTISAEVSAELEVAAWAGMMRIGYLTKRGLGIEYDVVGTPEHQLRRVNVYWRASFH